jgi:hypothetical protein
MDHIVLVPQLPAPVNESPRKSSKGTLYVKRRAIEAYRHAQQLRLDAATTDALVTAQCLHVMKVADGLYLSRTVIIQRAVAYYCQSLMWAAQIGNAHFLNTEKATLIAMSRESGTTAPAPIVSP